MKLRKIGWIKAAIEVQAHPSGELVDTGVFADWLGPLVDKAIVDTNYPFVPWSLDRCAGPPDRRVTVSPTPISRQTHEG